MGSLYDITELVEEVNLKEVVPEFYLESAKVDGKIYGIPNIQVISNPIAIHTDKEQAEKLGIDMKAIEEAAQSAKNIDDVKKYTSLLDDAFAKLHAAQPDKYVFNPNWNIIGEIYYESLLGGIGIKHDGSSNKLVNMAQTEEYKHAAEKYHEWFTKGYIRGDIASKGVTVADKEEARQYLTTSTTWKPGQEVSDESRHNYTPEYALLHKPYVKRTSALATMISIGANSKHPKEAMEFIKLINSDKELFNIICWGVEGTHYTKDENGRVTEIENSGYTGIGANAWKYGNQFNAYLTPKQQDGVWEATEEMNNNAITSPMLGFVPDTDGISTELANISNVQSEYQARMWGTQDPATWYDEYLKKLDEAGIEKVLNEMQKQYDAFLATK